MYRGRRGPCPRSDASATRCARAPSIIMTAVVLLFILLLLPNLTTPPIDASSGGDASAAAAWFSIRLAHMPKYALVA